MTRGGRSRGRGRALRAAVLVLMLSLLAGCSTADPSQTLGIPPDPVLPATARLAEAEQMIAEIAQAVSPGTTITKSDTASWDDCTAPLEGQVYKTITRTFPAPPGHTGADLVPALRQQFRDRGYYVTAIDSRDNLASDSFRGSTTHVGFSAAGYKTTPEVMINLATQCGSPPPDDPAA